MKCLKNIKIQLNQNSFYYKWSNTSINNVVIHAINKNAKLCPVNDLTSRCHSKHHPLKTITTKKYLRLNFYHQRTHDSWLKIKLMSRIHRIVVEHIICLFVNVLPVCSERSAPEIDIQQKINRRESKLFNTHSKVNTHIRRSVNATRFATDTKKSESLNTRRIFKERQKTITLHIFLVGNMPQVTTVYYDDDDDDYCSSDDAVSRRLKNVKHWISCSAKPNN